MLVMLAASGCYHPSVATGVPCGDNNACPEGQQCIAGFCGGSGSGSDVDGNVADTAPLIDAPALCTTWSARHFDPCMLPAPIGDLHLTQALSGFSWDLGTGVLKGKMNTTIPVTTTVMTQTVGPEVLVASVNDFTLDAGATLDLNGSRALLLAVWGTATIAGSINADASLSTPGPGGAGAFSSALGCGSAPTGDFGAAGSPATAGGGGAFQGNGGAGGNAGGGGGLAIPAPTTIQGGCAAGGGGAGTGASGTRGAGGGAIQITARQAIAIMAGANIHAGGGGGTGGAANYGAGGGGGAGGYIGLDAPTVTIAGTLAANGGSGGGGASDVASGSNGVTGRADPTVALGGLGATTTNVGACGRGGSGSAGGTLTGAAGGTSSCGGAGGGGGAGFILVWSPAVDATGATLSPPVMGGP